MVLSLLEEVGRAPVFVETAGAGQSDTALTHLVDCVVLVLTPHSGDVIQMLKAGLMERADVYVVNKSDLEGARQFAQQLRAVPSALSFTASGEIDGRVHLLSASDPREGDLLRLIASLESVARSRKRPRADLWRAAVSSALEDVLVRAYRARLIGSSQWDCLVDLSSRGRLTVDEAARQLSNTQELEQ